MKYGNYIRRIICLPVVAIMLLLCGCDGEVASTYRNVNGGTFESRQLAENSGYRLEWDNDGKAVLYKSLTNGHYWSDILYDAFKDGSAGPNALSAVGITISNSKTLKWDTVYSSSEMEENGKILCKKIKDGIRVTYFFDKYEIAVPIEYVLKDDCLEVVLNSANILENGEKYKLISVSVAPYLCSVKNNTEGAALFVPTGSGALMYTNVTPEGVRKYSGEVYGKDAARRIGENLTDQESIRLPVFGVYEKDKAILGIIKEGAGAARIDAQAGDGRLGYSSVGVTFYTRGYDTFEHTFFGKEKGYVDRVAKKLSENKMTVAFYPLYGENANYSGMANKYREYLKETYGLEKNNTGSSYGVTILGGTNTTISILGVPKKKTVALTTFSEALSIVEELEKKNGKLPIVRMMGYGDKGITPGKVAGGKSYSSVYGKIGDLNSLLKYSESTDIFMDADIVNFKKSGGGFSLNRDVAKTAVLSKANEYPISPTRIKDKDNPYFILSRKELKSAAETAVKKANKYGYKAVSFASLGGTAYSDYSDSKYTLKNGIEKDVTDILQSAKKGGQKTAVSSANSYAACAADVLFDTNITNGDYDAFDVGIPFYQMVFHSYKPMYTTALNYEGNFDLAVAKAAAYGMGLGFDVTYRYEKLSDDLESYPLYATVFEDNTEKIYNALIKNGYDEIYTKLQSEEIINYSIGQNGISITEYANGIKVYANFSKKKAESPIGILEPYQYKIG